MKVKFVFLALLTIFSATPQLSWAQEDDGFEAYDPFADYSEFEQASEEEADINFFRNGRFFAVGLQGGYRTFTNILGELYDPGVAYGLFLSYFFDLRFAIQISYQNGDHDFNLISGGNPIRGNVSIQDIGFGVKYFLNTQNVTRGLAPINPYIMLTLSQVTRTQRYSDIPGSARDTAMGFGGTFGVEFPMMRGQMFLGAEATYQYISFNDENSEISVGGTGTDVYPNGDIVKILGVIGFNF